MFRVRLQFFHVNVYMIFLPPTPHTPNVFSYETSKVSIMLKHLLQICSCMKSGKIKNVHRCGKNIDFDIIFLANDKDKKNKL